MRFKPSSNKYTDLALETLLKLAMQKWEREGKKEDALKMLEQAKGMGLFGDTSGGGAAGSPFEKQPIPSAYMKGLNLETGIPEIGLRTPEGMKGLQFQQDVGRFKAAESEYGLGKGMTKAKFSLMPNEQRGQFIKNRLANFPGASTAMKELRPNFGGKTYKQNVKGAYEEFIPAKSKTQINVRQPIVDRTGKTVAYKPTGSVFQPAPKKDEVQYNYDQALTQKVISNIQTEDDFKELMKNKTAYEKAGIDMGTVIKAHINSPFVKKNPNLWQMLTNFITGNQ